VKRLVFSLTLALLLCARSASANEKVRVLVPDRDNLQYMSFWVAKGAGYFGEEGIDIDLVVASAPQQTTNLFTNGEADAAVLPPPMYVNLIAAKAPVVLLANLLANDPIELIVRRSVMEERKLSPSQPLKQKLAGLNGLRLGVAPHPPSRLRALFASQGLDADKEVKLVILHGKEQNAAFHENEVDALYAHTPYLERAILNDDAVVLVDQCRGEAPELAHRQIHAFAMQRRYLEEHRPLALAAIRAIDRAERLIHASQEAAVNAIAKEYPNRPRKEIETIVRLYEPAIPTSTEMKALEIPKALELFPANMPKPDLAGIDLDKHVFIPPTPAEAAKPRRAWMIVGAVVAGLALLSFIALRSKKGQNT